jgi:hypothetical protein
MPRSCLAASGSGATALVDAVDVVDEVDVVDAPDAAGALAGAPFSSATAVAEESTTTQSVKNSFRYMVLLRAAAAA